MTKRRVLATWRSNDHTCVRTRDKCWKKFPRWRLETQFLQQMYKMCSFYRLKKYAIDLSQWRKKSKVNKAGVLLKYLSFVYFSCIFFFFASSVTLVGICYGSIGNGRFSYFSAHIILRSYALFFFIRLKPDADLLNLNNITTDLQNLFSAAK